VLVAIRDVLPFAVVVLVSPINIIAVILLLLSDRPTARASAYFGGFLVGVFVVVAAVISVVERLEESGLGSSCVAAWVRIALGVALLAAALQKAMKLRARHRVPELPAWMNRVSNMTPGRAAGLGLGIGALNPKNLAMAVAAAIAVRSASLHLGGTLVIAALYTVVAGLGVGAPIVMTLVLGDRAPVLLERWRQWLGRNNVVVMLVIYLVFAVVLIATELQAQ
jgi:hypothetical protein